MAGRRAPGPRTHYLLAWLRGSSDGFTYLNSTGPVPYSTIVVFCGRRVREVVHAGRQQRIPAGASVLFAAAPFVSLSPMPNVSAPDTTTTFSSVGCECAGMA